jgi:hypothetical protein
MHEFSRGSRACSSGKFLNLHSLKCHFLDFGEIFYRILMVRKRHCNISEALANVFALSPKTWGPPFGPLRLGAPGFSRSEPIVVTPLIPRDNVIFTVFHSNSRFRNAVWDFKDKVFYQVYIQLFKEQPSVGLVMAPILCGVNFKVKPYIKFWEDRSVTDLLTYSTYGNHDGIGATDWPTIDEHHCETSAYYKCLHSKDATSQY